MAWHITTKGRYGLRAVSYITRFYGQGPVSIQRIAGKENIPIRYLEQILSQLRRKNILKSIRGPGGGYVLSRPPDKITISEILEVLEGDLAVVMCTKDDNSNLCPQINNCVTKPFWGKLSDTIEKILADITLQQFNEVDWAQVDYLKVKDKR
jgi:Rrf2 family protein